MGLNEIIALQHARMKLYTDSSLDSDEGVFDNFERNPSHRNVIYKEDTIGVHVIDDGIRSNISYRKVIAQPPTRLQTGDYISISETDMWLCVNEDDLLYNKTTFALCNKTIKWIDKNNILIEKPCIVSAQTLYTTGVKEGKIIQIPDGMVGIQLPYDEDTKQLNRDSSFVFNKTKYKITFYNEVEFPGLLVVICDEDIPKPDFDDMENEIANRWDKEGNDRLEDNSPSPSDPDEISIAITGSDRLVFLSEETYVANIYNGDTLIDGEVTFKLSNKLATIKSQGNNTCTLKPNSNFDSGSVVLTATLIGDDEVTETKTITVSGF